MGQTKEQRIIKQLSGNGQVQTQTAIATDMFLPNHSGIASHPEFKKEVKDFITGADVPTYEADTLQSVTDRGATTTTPSTFSGGMTSKDFTLSIDTAVPSTLSVALAGAGAGNVNNGAHDYVVVFYNAFGRSTISSTASVTVVDNTTNGQVSITNIPVSARADVIGRKIYRTTIAGSYSGGGRYYLLATITNNTATTYTDNIADATINTITAEVIMADSPALMNSTTWDTTRTYNAKTLQTTTKDYDELFYDTTYNKPFFALDRSAGRLWLGDPDKFKNSQYAPTYLYVDTDVANSSTIATYIVPSGSTRLYFGSSSAKLYSINFGGVNSFESFPGYISMSSNTNAHNFGAGTSSAIASSNNRDLMLTTASGTAGVYLSSSGNASTATRVMPFITYAQNGDSYKWTASHYYYNTYYNATDSGTDFPYHTKWLSAGTLLGGLTMGGVFQLPKISPISDGTTAIQFFKADGTTVVMTIDTTNSKVIAPYFQTSTAITANSTGTVVIVAKDTGTLTANAGWLPMKKSDGATIYIPYWT
jgi:hypothetical protein